VFAGCAHGSRFAYPHSCTTRCGMSLVAPANCDGFQQQEDITLDIFDKRGIAKRADACKALRNYEVEVITRALPDGSFIDTYGRRVGGDTSCPTKTIAVGSGAWHSVNSALSHEMLHAILDCETGPNGEDHYQWNERGYYRAIRDCHDLPAWWKP
jgi:hypothetical protein